MAGPVCQPSRLRQPHIADGVHEEQGPPPIHASNNQTMACRVDDKAQLGIFGVNWNDWPVGLFVDWRGCVAHPLDKLNFTLHACPHGGIESTVSRQHRDLANCPQGKTGSIRLGSETAEEIVIDKIERKLLRNIALASTCQSHHDVGAIAQPWKRIVGGISRARLIIYQTHHQVRGLRIQTSFETGVRQLQVESRGHTFKAQSRRSGGTRGFDEYGLIDSRYGGQQSKAPAIVTMPLHLVVYQRCPPAIAFVANRP